MLFVSLFMVQISWLLRFDWMGSPGCLGRADRHCSRGHSCGKFGIWRNADVRIDHSSCAEEVERGGREEEGEREPERETGGGEREWGGGGREGERDERWRGRGGGEKGHRKTKNKQRCRIKECDVPVQMHIWMCIPVTCLNGTFFQHRNGFMSELQRLISREGLAWVRHSSTWEE